MTKLLFILFVLACSASCMELLVTKEYTDYLKKHVGWEVADYEENIFRGWTTEEAALFLGAIPPSDLDAVSLPAVEPSSVLPAALDWTGQKCDHGVRNQGSCGSCWAFAAAGMLSDRCCLQNKDHGWLSVQELVSCDTKSKGCSGGWCTWALDYVKAAHGLVPEDCYPYLAKDKTCPRNCTDGRPWADSHVCACSEYKMCVGVESMKTCIKSGPVTGAFGVCRSFFSYKSGTYKCDCNGNYVGLHAVLVMGYSTDKECVFRVRNSWGESWGLQGYFDIGCLQCGIAGTFSKGNVICDKVGSSD